MAKLFEAPTLTPAPTTAPALPAVKPATPANIPLDPSGVPVQVRERQGVLQQQVAQKQNNDDADFQKELAKAAVVTQADINAALEDADGRKLSPAARAQERAAEMKRVRELNQRINPNYQNELDAAKAARIADQGKAFGIGKDAAVITQADFKEPNKEVAATPAGFSGGAAVGAPLDEKPLSKAASMVKKMTEGGPTVKKEPTDTDKAIKNAFDSKKIFDLVGGLGASLESAYGNRGMADTLYGKKWGAEDAAAQELERLGKAQGFTSAEADKQRAFEATQNAANRDVQLQASGAIQGRDKQGMIANALIKKFLEGGALTPEQSKFISGYTGTSAGILGSSLGAASNDPLGVRK